jgi:uncharacterized protein (DUF2164 family)
MSNASPRRVRLSPERRASLLRALTPYCRVLDFFVREPGPPVSNQGVRDAAAFMHDTLNDIDGEVYEREPSS